MRKHYEITMAFIYKNGMTGGRLNATVNSKKAIKRQIEASREWLIRKGHTETGLEVKEVQ